MSAFINFSNHNSKDWIRNQKEEAEQYGEIIDIPFPKVEAMLNEAAVYEIACDYFKKIIAYNPAAVMCQGEFTLCYLIIHMLLKEGVKVLAACSERIVEEAVVEEDYIKKACFKFVRFREYREE